MSQQCTATTKRGPCLAWAIVGTDPPLCPAHAGIKRRSGPARANQNARKSGFYSRALEEQELADLVVLGDDSSLTDEIAATRVAMRRVLAALGTDKATLEPQFAAQIFEGARTVARLLRDRRAISGDAADTLLGAIGEALDQLNTLWGTDL